MNVFEVAGLIYFTVGVLAALIMVSPYKQQYLLRLGITILFWPFPVFMLIILRKDGLWYKLGWW